MEVEMKPFKSNTYRPRLGKINPVSCAKWSGNNVDNWIKRGLGK